MEIIVRRSTKTIKSMYVLAALIAAVVFIAGWVAPPRVNALLALPVLIAGWNAIKHLSSRFERMILSPERLTFEEGFLNKKSRSIEIGKVQDVGVEQTLSGRLLSIGDLSVETAGGSSRITVANIDRPKEIADMILRYASGRPAKGQKV